MASQPDYKKILGFTDDWLALGIVSEDQVIRLGQRYDQSDDKNAEHYRYAAFRDFLSSVRPLQTQRAQALYNLGRLDPDAAMGEAMMHDMVTLPECPEELQEHALASGRKHLIRAVARSRLRQELRRGISQQLFTRILESHDNVIQRELVNGYEISRQQMEQIAEAGANAAVRNIAKSMLRKRTR